MFSIEAVITLIVYLVAIGLIFWLLWWLLNRVNPPEPFKKIADIVLAVAAVLVAIGILLSFIGHPLFK